MTGETTTSRRAVDEDRIDAAGWWQLGGMAVFGAAVPFCVVLFPFDRPAPWTAAVVLALALAVVLPMVQVFAWARRGGRAAVVATRTWVRSGSVPADVPEQVWRPRVQQYADDLDRRTFGAWSGVVLTGVWGVMALVEDPGHWITAVLWAGIAAVSFRQVRRDRPGVRRLLATTRS
jgi:hypothetical protein